MTVDHKVIRHSSLGKKAVNSLRKVNKFANISNMKWKVTYYDEKVFEKIQRWPKKLKARYVALTDVMMEQGPNLGMPHTKALSDGLFEIRVKAKEGIGRVFYMVQVGKEIVILHSFIKKTMKTPDKEKQIALRRLKEVKNHG